MTAADQLNRIVSLVADMSRRGDGAVTLAELAEAQDTTVHQVQADIRTLTALDNDPGADWLLALQVTQEGDRVELWSGGPFRRPVRLAPDELTICVDEAELVVDQERAVARSGPGAVLLVDLSAGHVIHAEACDVGGRLKV